MYLTFVSAIAPGRFLTDVVSRRAFQLALIEIDHIAAQVGVVFQDRPPASGSGPERRLKLQTPMFAQEAAANAPDA